MEELRQTQAAAFAAWKADPSAATTAALDAATKAVAAAKKVATATPVPDLGASLAAMDAAVADRKKAAGQAGRLKAACRLRMEADAYPRCGQGWPATANEIKAQALIDASPEEAERLMYD
jgi:hypothetical protein